MIKLLQVSILSIFLCSSAFAGDVHQKSNISQQTKALLPCKKVDGNEGLYKSGPVKISTTTSSANLPGTKVGDTAYNYQTNENLHDRIIYNSATGTIHVQWMYADIAEAGTAIPGRRMYYNHFDGVGWIHGAVGVPIENERAGYGSLAVDATNIAVGTSHHTITNEEACNAWHDFQSGWGFFSQSIIYEMREHGSFLLQPFWPDIAIDDQDNWHVVAINNSQDDYVEVLNDVHMNILYYRSTDRGQTWSDWYAMFPDSTTYPLTEGAAGPSSAGNQQIAVSDTDNGRVGVLITDVGHDLYLFESMDRGLNWENAVQVIGNKIFDKKDSITYPFLWDVVIVDSSEFGGSIDTIIYPYNRDSDTDEPEANIRPRPHGPADLIYINEEPHVVWSELIHTADNSSYPNGYSYWWTNPAYHFLKGDTIRREGGFSVKHWSPSTGISYIHLDNDIHDVWAGTFQQFITMPQLGIDESGTLYCLFTKYSDSDTLTDADGIDQAETKFGPLSFGKIWGAKSDDGGKTWYDAAQLIPDEDCVHQNLRYIGVADRNGADAINILYQNTPDVPGVPIGEDSDHDTWATADMIHWPIPVSTFPSTKDYFHGPELELVTSSTEGGLNFGHIGDAGSSTKSITVKNVGDRDLVVGDLFTSHRSFKASPISFTVAPGASQEVEVTFQPTVTDTFFAYLAIPNNDYTEASAGIPLEGSGIPTGVANAGNVQPITYSLEQNYPNPFNPITNIKFTIQQSNDVTLIVYNTLGEEIEVLVDRHMQAGSHQISWLPKNVSSGIYFYRLSAGDFSDIRKMILIK